MGVKERKERDRQEMREIILKSAYKLFLERGFDDVSIRNVAEAIEYSPATIYLYFKDKNEIIHALHRQAFEMLNKQFQPLAKIADPFARLSEMGKAYIKFAIKNAEMYKLLFIRSEPMEHLANCQETEWKEGDMAFDALAQTVAQCQQKGYFKNFDTHQFSMMTWSFTHGLCALRLSGHLGRVKEERESNRKLDQIMNETLSTFIQTLQKLKK
ncbi:MAG: TetR/AcrR family transcriptional regulator [Bacteroidetes bacterium]|nr:TetR/AcrR family transcriptional regulator [Bacteroidota bacterium]MBS1540491.1 TetR/AcrR family transcriptional regulator [Bacteroidota bacterium]